MPYAAICMCGDHKIMILGIGTSRSAARGDAASRYANDKVERTLEMDSDLFDDLDASGWDNLQQHFVIDEESQILDEDTRVR